MTEGDAWHLLLSFVYETILAGMVFVREATMEVSKTAH